LDLWVAESQSCHWWWPYEGIVIASERHSVVKIDGAGRLHCQDGPAVAYADGYGLWAWNGVRVEREVIEQPITVEQIENEKNAEVRRVMTERYGLEKYIQDCGAEEVQKDDFGTLWRKRVPNDEPILMVQVVNSTAEPDGTSKDYFLRVDPQCRPIIRTDDEPGGRLLGEPQKLTARNAVASTFGMKGAEYRPLIQT
jgi:hypothetical protein